MHVQIDLTVITSTHLMMLRCDYCNSFLWTGMNRGNKSTAPRVWQSTSDIPFFLLDPKTQGPNKLPQVATGMPRASFGSGAAVLTAPRVPGIASTTKWCCENARDDVVVYGISASSLEQVRFFLELGDQNWMVWGSKCPNDIKGCKRKHVMLLLNKNRSVCSATDFEPERLSYMPTIVYCTCFCSLKMRCITCEIEQVAVPLNNSLTYFDYKIVLKKSNKTGKQKQYNHVFDVFR